MKMRRDVEYDRFANRTLLGSSDYFSECQTLQALKEEANKPHEAIVAPRKRRARFGQQAT